MVYYMAVRRGTDAKHHKMKYFSPQKDLVSMSRPMFLLYLEAQMYINFIINRLSNHLY